MRRAHQLKLGQIDDQYRLYCAYSKNASRLLMLLVTFAFYLGVTIYENGQLMDRTHITVMQSLITSYFVPTPEEYHSGMVDALSKIQYTLPVIGTTLYMKRFFSFAPLLFLGIATFYWIYLKLALRAFSRFASMYGHFPVTKLYPWVYNLPIRWDIGTIIWQSLIELFPLLFLLASMIAILPGYARFYDLTMLFAGFGVAPLLVHALIFRPRILPDESQPLTYLAFQLVLAIFTIEKVFSTDSSLLSNWLFLFFGLAATEAFLIGRYYLTFPFLLTIGLPYGMYKKKTIWILPIFWRLFVENLKEPVSGYIGYLRDRASARKRRQYYFRDL